ncbi:hypothetical protein L6164_004654 [Bauhinia variegata]|uniref:Uncharacterized protein n=1 Tax=Bauhinia variegata TaxID=167791 RepID=A0ACB9Q4M1_BAUVA|nr:hypothetical protein L6164_004654 [Bauhinia variegata]
MSLGVIEGSSRSRSGSGSGKKWAVLVAGSNGYDNYRHQADICHAYQILKKGGLKDENTVVFMYDDIAFNPSNPRPGVIINKPNDNDVYQGVPKDYTASQVNPTNLYAVILGNPSALTGGSGKVVDSGPHDFIFIYYADHGAPGILGMPDGQFIYANDLVRVLKKKHAANAYKRMTTCESGSIFEGLLPNDINIYAANAEESSYGTYCPYFDADAPPEYTTCLGDLYSISWMEDSDKHDMANETLRQQYGVVIVIELHSNIVASSHVMQYGNKDVSKDSMATYIGTDPAAKANGDSYSSSSTRLLSQRDGLLLHLSLKVNFLFLILTLIRLIVDSIIYWHSFQFQKAPDGSIEKVTAQKELADEISQRENLDSYMGELLFGKNKSAMLANVRPAGQPLVDDWDCFKTLMKTYQSHCGSLSRYGMRYSRAIAKMCNAGIRAEQMVAALSRACPTN